MSCLLIVNPIAGRRRPEAAPDNLLRTLQAHSLKPELFCTQRRGDAEEAARQAAARGVELIIVAGGDGTINEVVNGLNPQSAIRNPQSIPLCIVPCGTANVLAYELGLPTQIEAACALAVNGVPRAIDVGVANGRAFVLAAGIGFDAALIRGVSLSLKPWIGQGAYWLAGFRQLARARPAVYRLRMDSEPVGANLVFALRGRPILKGKSRFGLYGLLACNTAHYAGRYRLSPTAAPDDGLLDLYLLHARGPANLFLSLLMAAQNRAHVCPHITCLRVRSVECRTAPVMPVQLDGDDFGDTPVSIHVAPGGMRVLTPRT